MIEGGLYKQFALRARHEHGRAHIELQLEELPVARDVGQGLAGDAARESRFKALTRVRLKGVREAGVEFRARPAAGMAEEDLGFEPCVMNARVFQALRGVHPNVAKSGTGRGSALCHTDCSSSKRASS